MQKRTKAQEDEIAHRRRQVMELRLSHHTVREIASILGVSHGLVGKDMQEIRKEWAQRRVQDYDEWVSEEIAKLDALERAWLPLAINSRQPDGVAAQRVLQIIDRRSKLLGLDQPQQLQHTVLTQDILDREMVRLEKQLAKLDG